MLYSKYAQTDLFSNQLSEARTLVHQQIRQTLVRFTVGAERQIVLFFVVTLRIIIKAGDVITLRITVKLVTKTL